jgi:hypothetical protein
VAGLPDVFGRPAAVLPPGIRSKKPVTGKPTFQDLALSHAYDNANNLVRCRYVTPQYVSQMRFASVASALSLSPFVAILAYAVGRLFALGRKSWSLVVLSCGLYGLFLVILDTQVRLYSSATGIRDLGHSWFVFFLTASEVLGGAAIALLVVFSRRGAGAPDVGNPNPVDNS